MPKQNSVVVLEASRYSLSRSSTAFSTIYIHLRTKKKRARNYKQGMVHWILMLAFSFSYFKFFWDETKQELRKKKLTTIASCPKQQLATYLTKIKRKILRGKKGTI
ncbi:hypothetical protein TorRG33x02_091740 [Trema orientale]|uniref:Uncharacterized protein n=1 Tax=Trema orientale TaxID=63057 RepID=A0A2P5FB10_TREOI|nr:hypothetical protein TorRG33x02_091740 [Trema orientale]